MRYIFNILIIMWISFPCLGHDKWDSVDDVFTGGTNLGIPSNILQSHGPHNLGINDTDDWFKVTLDAGILYEFTPLRYLVWVIGNTSGR